MDILVDILPWLGFGVGTSLGKFYLFAVSQPFWNRPMILWKPVGHVICTVPIALGVWSAIYLPIWGILLLAILTPNALVVIMGAPLAASDARRLTSRQGGRAFNVKTFSELPGPDLAVLELLRCSGALLNEEDYAIFTASLQQLSGVQESRLETLKEAALTGFFCAASEGKEFASPDLIRRKFGCTLGENYHEAGPTFLRFARTYWTFKLLADSAEYSPASRPAHAVFESVELAIASVFFPTPGGAVRIHPDQREAKQRELLSKYSPGLDVEEFIRRNPILLRDRGLSSRRM